MIRQNLQIVAHAGARSDHRVLTLIGPLSLETVPDFLRMVRGETAPVVVLNFADVPFVDSAGVGALVQSYVRFMNSKRRLALTNLNPRVMAVLEITRVHKFFPIFATVDQAEAQAV